MRLIKVKKLISYEQAAKYKKDIGTIGGFFKDGMRWKDYIVIWNDRTWPYIEAARKYIIENKLKFGGDDHQYRYTPLFNDNTVMSCSYRAWGDFMAAVWSTEENKDYNYMSFYMTCLIKE